MEPRSAGHAPKFASPVKAASADSVTFRLVKPETHSFYQLLVQRAVERVASRLDDALDLSGLARGAALSPLHFHRIFRGLAGETPLELHRRLRLERAAWQLAHAERPITRIAFEAGYETHESFTRAFRAAYASSPSELRARARAARDAGTRPPALELAAPCGVHCAGPDTAACEPILQPLTEAESPSMNVAIVTLPEQRVAAVSHRGPYHRIFEAFTRLDEIVQPSGLLALPDLQLVAIYHDDPETTPPAEQRAEAGLVVPPDVALPEGLVEVQLAGGRYARTTHVGPYTLLGDTWARLMGGWLAQSGHRVGPGAMFERYLNTPANAKPEDLRTELYLLLA